MAGQTRVQPLALGAQALLSPSTRTSSAGTYLRYPSPLHCPLPFRPVLPWSNYLSGSLNLCRALGPGQPPSLRDAPRFLTAAPRTFRSCPFSLLCVSCVPCTPCRASSSCARRTDSSSGRERSEETDEKGRRAQTQLRVMPNNTAMGALAAHQAGQTPAPLQRGSSFKLQRGSSFKHGTGRYSKQAESTRLSPSQAPPELDTVPELDKAIRAAIDHSDQV